MEVIKSVDKIEFLLPNKYRFFVLVFFLCLVLLTFNSNLILGINRLFIILPSMLFSVLFFYKANKRRIVIDQINNVIIYPKGVLEIDKIKKVVLKTRRLTRLFTRIEIYCSDNSFVIIHEDQVDNKDTQELFEYLPGYLPKRIEFEKRGINLWI